MINSIRRARAALAVLGAAGLIASVTAADVTQPHDSSPVMAALQALKIAYPGSQVLLGSGQVIGVYGVPMGAYASATEAAESWLKAHAGVLGEPDMDLRLVRTGDLADGRFTVFAYEQYIEGLPVDLSTVKVVVRNGLPDRAHSVVYVGAKVTAKPVGGFLPDALDGELALAIARTAPVGVGLDAWAQPREVVYFGEGDGLGDGESEWIAPRRAWAVAGWASDPVADRAFTLFIDAATGEVIHARNDVAHSVTGQVQGRANTNLLAYSATAPINLPGATPVPVPGARVNVAGSNPHDVFANLAGAFTTLPFVGPATLTASLTNMAWFNVVDQADAISTAVVSVNPGDAPILVLNPNATEWDTSEVNAILAVNATRQFILDRAPGATFLNTALTVNVNVNSTCNANFNPNNLSLNFFRSGGGCNNTAYSTVTAHEYGHFVVNRLGLAQGAFGEGFGDCCSELVYDAAILGDGFITGATPGTPSSYIRNPEAANQQYPCSGEIHACGMTLAGFWRETRNNLVAAHGLNAGLAQARQLFVDWMQITVGGSGSNSATPSTVIEVLTLNDNDGNVGNGTPDFGSVCEAASEHGLSCPALSPLDVTFPDGRPTLVTPGSAFGLRINILPLAETLRPGTVQLLYRVGGGAFTPSTPTALSASEFLGQLPAAPCGTYIEYYVSAVSDFSSTTVVAPSAAPATPYSVGAAYGLLMVSDSMETNPGWTVSGNATLGVWERGNPQATIAQPEDDTTPALGVNCWVTGALAGAAAGSFDVDGGATVLTSPAYDLSAGVGHRIKYNRWYSNSAGSAANADIFTVEVSSNNGGSWTTAETVGPAGTGTSGGWITAEWSLSAFALPSSQVRLRFTASDLGSGSLVEAAIDDLMISALDCTPPPATCLADITGVGGTVESPMTPDGQLTLDDILLFVNLFSEGTGCPGAAPCSRADVTGVGGPPLSPDGQLTLDDLLAFVNDYSEGCS